jgi:mannose-1-phosphate guanylyltransferase
MTTAMVLCAGFGTRLRPLTNELPKPLVPVGDQPLLAHIVERLEAVGVANVVLNVHHGADKFNNYIKYLTMKPQVVVESEIRGTAGGIAGARPLLGAAPVIVHTGDILTLPPVRQLLDQVDDGLCLAVTRRTIGEGPVGLGRDGRVVRLRGQRFGEEVSGAQYIGVSALGARCLETLPQTGCLIRDWALVELAAGRVVSSVSVAGSFQDLGDVPAYLDANLAWLAGRKQWIGSGAQVGDKVELDRAIIGKGAIVSGVGRLERCVIWPGARARAPMVRSVVTAQGEIVRVP